MWYLFFKQNCHQFLATFFEKSAQIPYQLTSADAGSGSLLPVELVSFGATADHNAVALSWTTATEVNNYGFEIEKAATGDQSSAITWNKVGFVEGSGTTNSPKEYSFTDNNLSAGKYS